MFTSPSGTKIGSAKASTGALSGVAKKEILESAVEKLELEIEFALVEVDRFSGYGSLRERFSCILLELAVAVEF